MTREELQSAIQDFFDEAFHCGKHEISDTSKAIALDCMMDAAERKRTCHSTNADRIRGAEFLSTKLNDDFYEYPDLTLQWLQQPAEEDVAIEEMSELIKAICKMRRAGVNEKPAATDAIVDEIADVSIMMEQLCMMYECFDAVENRRRYKVRRLENRLK